MEPPPLSPQPLCRKNGGQSKKPWNFSLFPRTLTLSPSPPTPAFWPLSHLCLLPFDQRRFQKGEGVGSGEGGQNQRLGGERAEDRTFGPGTVPHTAGTSTPPSPSHSLRPQLLSFKPHLHSQCPSSVNPTPPKYLRFLLEHLLFLSFCSDFFHTVVGIL